MYEHQIESEQSTQEQYDKVFASVILLIKNDDSIEDKLTKVVNLLFNQLSFDFIGFYKVNRDDFLMGPYRSKNIVSYSTNYQKICDVAYHEERIVMVDDVESFSGCCLQEMGCKSVIAVPIFKNGEVDLILYISSNEENYFTKLDKCNLSQIMGLVEGIL